MKYSLLALSVCLVSCVTVEPVPTLTIADRLVWSDPPILKATGLMPGTDYTLITERNSQWGTAVERSELTYTTDQRGRIDTSRMVAVGPKAVNPYEPIRSMSYLHGETIEGLKDHTLRFSLLDKNGEPVAVQDVGIGPDKDALIEDALGESFPGAYVLRQKDANDPAPAIVVLGGSEGGDGGSRSVAPIYAAEGFTVLGLPYYSPAWFGQGAQFPDLPQAFAEIPVDYLEEAVATLRQRPDVDADRILLSGGSKGAEFVLLAGALIPDESDGGGFCAIIADVPSDVVWEGWGAGAPEDRPSSFSWRGEALPFVPYKDIGRALDRSDPYTMTDAHVLGRADNPDRVPAARIRVEKIDEPVLVIGGMKDEVWNSGEMARAITNTRDAVGLETEAYVYEEGGHGVGGSPLVRTSQANLEARLESFPAVIRFMKRHASRTNCRTR